MIKSICKILIEFNKYRFYKILASITSNNEYKFSAECTKKIIFGTCSRWWSQNIIVSMTGGIFGTFSVFTKII